MWIFDKFFRKGDCGHPEPEPCTCINLPYETVQVAGSEAVSTCLRLREEGAGRFTPIILGDPNDLGLLLDGIEADRRLPQRIIDLSAGISMRSFMERRIAEEEEYYRDVEEGDWPDDETPSQELMGHKNVLRGVPLKTVAICKIPTPRSWEVPAYLSFGGWNECPAPEEHVALLRYWHENYGADIITVTSDVIECTVSRPPAERSQALALAREHFVYCADIVYQGTESISSLAAVLCGGKTWYFWWD